MKNFKRIFLVGFRTTGKSTLGKILAQKLNWSFFDLDFLISQQSNEDIGTLTKNGADWKEFRKIENEILEEVSKLDNVVISCGGGVGVNDVLDEETKKTFGELNKEILQSKKDSLVILLSSDEKIIEARLARLFEKNKIMPFINKKNAKKSNEIRNKTSLVAKQVKDSMQTLMNRKSLYEKIADIEIDTSDFVLPEKLENVFTVIGNPINHSLSPKMHNSAYKALGIEDKNLFIPIRVNEKGLENFIEAVKLISIKGVSVTIPNKENVIKYLDEIDENAKKIGAVNTIINHDGKLKGSNTDWIGAVTALEKKTNLKGKKVAVIGAGGAAKAIVFGLLKKGAMIKIFNRSLEKAKILAKEFGVEWGEDMEEIKGYDIIINATSVGINEDKSLISEDLLNKNQIVFDIIYSPKETKLIKEARRKGAQVIYGYEMLLYQGVEQFKLYTGLEAPVKEMEKTLVEGLK